MRGAIARDAIERLTRHTYAALMVQANVHPKMLQAQLGHASIAVTLNTYGHLFPDAFADVADALDGVLRIAAGGTACKEFRLTCRVSGNPCKTCMELSGLEPLTSWVRSRRSPN